VQWWKKYNNRVGSTEQIDSIRNKGGTMAKGRDAQKADKKKSEKTLKEKRKAKKEKKDKA
jgi:hypothetical protein